jgi:hypothetical protein
LTVFKQKVVRIFSDAPAVNDSDRLITDHDIPQKAQSAIKDEVSRRTDGKIDRSV